MRRVKIVATIGPASESPDILRKLIAAGLDVARLNFSHGSHEGHARIIGALREAAEATGKPIAILQDLQGPRIRIGKLSGGPVLVEAGRALILTTDEEAVGDAIPVTYPHLPADVKPGDRILIDDGLIELAVEGTGPKTVRCRVITGGTINPNKGMNLPGVAVTAPTLGDKDLEDLAFGLSHGVDYVALSFVRSPEDVTAAREYMKKYGAEAPLIAKIERPEAVERLDDIVAAADCVMIARGDLAVETSPEAVPLIQKRIIRACNQARAVVITATQMLESMTVHPRPTRAEASDVANAVLDGTDAVMLSGETAAGRYPVEAVETMARIVEATEAGQEWVPHAAPSPLTSFPGTPASFPAAVCAAGARAASETGAKVIVAFTETGTTARLLSKERPTVPILAYTPHEPIRRRMALYWGVLPRATHATPNTDQLIRELERSLRDEKLAGPGDRIVILLGAPVGARGSTNLMKLHTIA
jgi:pyruvate kinase